MATHSSILDNPVNRAAWWATVHRVAYNQSVKYTYRCEYFSGMLKYTLSSAMITHRVGTIIIMAIMSFSYVPFEILFHYTLS